MITEKIAQHVNTPARHLGFSNSVFEKDAREKFYVYHTHSLKDCKHICETDTVYYLLRKNLVEYVASHLISQDLQKWHWQPGESIKVTADKKSAPEIQIKIMICQMYWYYNSYKKYCKKFSNVHLIFYEDFVTNFTVPGIDLSNSRDQVGYFATTPIDKKSYFDYDHLTELACKYNNGSIYFDYSQDLIV